MLKYKVRKTLNSDVIERICENRGLDFTTIDDFLYPQKSSIQDYKDYKNMSDAILRTLRAKEDNEKVGILIDSDADGYCSAAMLYIYLTKVLKMDNVVYYFHSNKQHGLYASIMKEIIDSKVSLLFIPDASSNDYEQHRLLKIEGIDIIVLDHHICDKYSENAIVVNNQLQDGVNTNLCGAGIVQKFLEGLDANTGNNYSKELYGLLATALVADVMKINDLETRYYVTQGLRNPNNLMLDELYGVNSRNISDISFKIAPVINAYIRVGERRDKENLFKALIGVEETRCLEVRSKEVEMNLQEFVKYKSSRIKSLQSNLVGQSIAGAIDVIDTKICSIVILDRTAHIGLSGLMGNQVVDEVGKAALILREDSGIFYGSGRAPDLFQSFKDICKNTNLFKLAEGHNNAFGVRIVADNLQKLVEIFNSLEYKEKITEVDKEYIGRVSAYDIMKVSDYKSIWGNGFEEPKFYVSLEDVGEVSIIGASKNTIKFTKDSITFIKFNCDEETIELFKNKIIGNFEVIGTFNVNTWNDRDYPQVFIEDFEILSSRDKVEDTDFGFKWGF